MPAGCGSRCELWLLHKGGGEGDKCKTAGDGRSAGWRGGSLLSLKVEREVMEKVRMLRTAIVRLQDRRRGNEAWGRRGGGRCNNSSSIAY